MSDELAAIVRKRNVDAALAYLEEECVYDQTRRIARYDAEYVAIPIRQAIEHPLIKRIDAGVAGEPRAHSLEDHLRRRGWSDTDIERIPTSYARIGECIVFSEPIGYQPEVVAEALFAIHGEAKAVVEQRAITGSHRRPQISHIAGIDDTHTIHREHGIVYELDLSEVMFSPGNQHERKRMGDVVVPSERVLDMCAGIGYFTLPMAVNGAQVTAIERNPVSFRWLSRNLTHNGVDALVTPICGDCRETPVTADRVVLGFLDAHDARDGRPESKGYLASAVNAVDTVGTIHIHGITWAGEHEDARVSLLDRIESLDATVRSMSVHTVKTIAPGTEHIVFDVNLKSR